ncbi:PTS glucose transporter subunit IIA [Listeria monocytogenes]|nr:PTS glucose transporter subunit IIA [Listeria monocytogenes]EKM7736032.1 PTS glucose transporter subunit IIA [Listeria monocytogenes]EKM7739069.1 PTS glucose transporter subunit IIA [Listeria monocytogenes]EKM7742104.1 PTS glucose transporter subunit IIA [Listeria monocytogenes]EKM7745141.1 PTS glucose transporter subunit IIA [Listeria monocytogenes]
MDYNQLAKEILQAVGGKNNVNEVYHCITRLRFQLKDQSKVNEKQLKGLDKVMGTNVAGNQFQVIIGNDVPKVFDALAAENPAWKNKETTNKTTRQKGIKGFFSNIFDALSGVFAPILPAIAGAGLIKGFMALFVSLGWLATDTETYRILLAIGDGVFYFLPILVAVSAARYFKANMFVALGIGAALLYPDLTALLSAGTTPHFIGLPVTPVTYAYSVIPILLAIWIMSYVEKWMDRIIPTSLKLLFVPLITMFIVVPLTLVVIGPLGTFVGDGVSGGINWLLNNGGAIGGILIGGAMAIIVMTGMHYAIVPFVISNLAKYGYDKFLPLTYISNMSQAGATFGVFFRAKDKKLKSLAFSTGLTALMGVTEPAMYGINVVYKRPFMASLIGGAAGGGFAMMFGVKAYVLTGNGGIPGLPGLVGDTFVYALIAMALAFIVALIFSYIFGIDEQMVEATPVAEKIAAGTEILQAPVTGELVKMSQVNDTTFADEIMGKSIAIKPNEGKLYAPANGTIISLFKTKHAIAMKSDNGAEILLHVGIDTVKLDGNYFTAHVATGDVVEQGDLLVTFDMEKIAEKYDTTTMMVITNTNEYAVVEAKENGIVTKGNQVMELRSEQNE